MTHEMGGTAVDPSQEPVAEPAFVFISYAHADQAFVARLLADLAERGVSCWVDRQGLPPGTPDWEQAVREAIRACRVLLLVASPDSRQSRYVKAELGLAELYARPIYPLWVAGEHWLESVPLGLGAAQFVDAREEHYEHGLAEIVAALSGQPMPPYGAGAGKPVAARATPVTVSRHNLPAALTSLIGREREQREVLALLAEARLVTLTGSGGVGKTRLALAVAAELVDQYPDGVWLVDLAALAEPGLTPGAVAQALAVREEPGRPIPRTLTDHLKEKRLLLVLDNCEHLVAACAELAATLLQGCPRLHILATSREGLEVAGERSYRVPSLPVPDLAHLPPPERLAELAAVALFAARARERRADFALSAENARAVAQVCARLDGIPLAIELAAARVNSLPVEAIAARLDDRFRLLTRGSRAALPRQQTLRATLDWGYDLLDEREQAMLRRVAVFEAGGWTLAAATAICTGDGIDEWDVLDLLDALANKSLLLGEPPARASADEPRYRLLETVRQYGREKLAAGGELAAARVRHCAHYLALAEEAEPALVGPEQVRWLARLEEEHDNLRAALTWSIAGDGRPEEGLALAGLLWRFWYILGHLREGREWLERALAAAGATAAPAALARAFNGVGNLAQAQGDLDHAVAFHRQSLALRRQLDDARGIAASLANLGNIAWSQARYDQATALIEESLDVQRGLGDTWGIAASLNSLAGVNFDQGAYARAAALYEETLALHRGLANTSGIAFALTGMGTVAARQREYDRAAALHGESLTMSRDLGDKGMIAWIMEEMAMAASDEGRHEPAARLFGAAEAVREAVGRALEPSDQALRDHAVEVSRRALGDAAFATTHAQGRALPQERAVAFALEHTGRLEGGQSPVDLQLT